MTSKYTLLFCVQALIIQTISSQCIPNNLYSYDHFGCGSPYVTPSPCEDWTMASIATPFAGPYSICSYTTRQRPSALAASNGGGFTSFSSSPISPNGIFVSSNSAIKGPVAVGGRLPLLGAVAFEATFPTVGAGTVVYSCGNGAVGMTSEDLIAFGFADEFSPHGPGNYVASGSFGCAGNPCGYY